MLCLIADDHPIYRSAIVNLLKNEFKEFEIKEADCFDGLLKAVEEKLKPDLILLDLNMPGVQGYSGLLFMQSVYPKVPIIIISGNASKDIASAAIGYGAKTFISKSSPVEIIVDRINTVLAGGECEEFAGVVEDAVSEQDQEMALKMKQLTPRQFQIMMLIAKGRLNKQIADELFISLSTVKNQVSSILKTLELSSRTHIAVIAKRLDIEEEDSF